MSHTRGRPSFLDHGCSYSLSLTAGHSATAVTSRHGPLSHHQLQPWSQPSALDQPKQTELPPPREFVKKQMNTPRALVQGGWTCLLQWWEHVVVCATPRSLKWTSPSGLAHTHQGLQVRTPIYSLMQGGMVYVAVYVHTVSNRLNEGGMEV